MANQWQININPNPQGTPRVKFEPDPRKANPLDQIFWTNNDTVAHWPGLQNADGTPLRGLHRPVRAALPHPGS